MKQFEVGKSYIYTNGRDIGRLTFLVTARTDKTVTLKNRLFGEITKRVTVVDGIAGKHESVNVSKHIRINAWSC